MTFDPAYEASRRVALREKEREITAERRRESSPLTLVSANGAVKRTRWVWEGRVPQGMITLVAGRESTGKSTVVADLAASLSLGELPGEYLGTPKVTMIVNTEESVEHQIRPKLIAAGANLDLVHILHGDIDLGVDIERIEKFVEDNGVSLLVIDPLISRLGDLDTHRDSEVRQALEPLKAMAERLGLAVVGLLHFNKTGTTDPLNAIMGSRAFTAVPRSVLTTQFDPDDESRQVHLLAHAKCNVGKLAPTLTYTIGSRPVGEDDGTVYGSRIDWNGEDDRNAYEIAEQLAPGKRTKRETAADWLHDYIEKHGGEVMSHDAMFKGAVECGVSEKTVSRAATELGVLRSKSGQTPGIVLWKLPPTEDKPVA